MIQAGFQCVFGELQEKVNRGCGLRTHVASIVSHFILFRSRFYLNLVTPKLG